MHMNILRLEVHNNLLTAIRFNIIFKNFILFFLQYVSSTSLFFEIILKTMPQMNPMKQLNLITYQCK